MYRVFFPNAGMALLYNDEVLYTDTEGEVWEEMVDTIALDQTKSANDKSMHQLVTDNDYRFVYSSPESEFKIALTVPLRDMNQSVYLLRRTIILLTLMILIISLAVFYYLSLRLSRPLIELKTAIDSIELYDSVPDIDNQHHMNEVEIVNRSFRRMGARLQQSADELVNFRTMQLKSQFDNLQAQIHPHMLFNVLGSMQVSADNSDYKSVTAVSRNLIHFLRYTFDSKKPLATLEQEISITSGYLEMMKTCYQQRLEYTVESDSIISKLLLPKLSIQPLVENSIKHGFSEEHRLLRIHINASIMNGNWQLTVTDNGRGISPTEIIKLNASIDSYLESLHSSEPTQGLSIGGMGLINTIARFKLHFKDRFAFRISNKDNTGTDTSTGVVIHLSGPIT